MRQDFDQVSEGFEGRLGESPSASGGRWVEFGGAPGMPRIQSGTAREGNAVELTRIDGDSRHTLYGIFTPITSARRLEFSCQLKLGDKSGTIVGLARGNDLAAGVTLYGPGPGIRGWNAQSRKWDVVREAPLPDEWCKIVLDCDVEGATYTIQISGPRGEEIVKREMPFDVSLLPEGGIGVVLVNPQLPAPFFLDDVTLNVER